MFKKHPKTTFIAAHFGWYPNDLAKLSSLMDAMPNIVVEFGAVIAELGRQPKMAKAFFTKYQDQDIIWQGFLGAIGICHIFPGAGNRG